MSVGWNENFVETRPKNQIDFREREKSQEQLIIF